MLLHHFQALLPFFTPKTKKGNKNNNQINLNSKTLEDILMLQWERKYRTGNSIQLSTYYILGSSVNNFLINNFVKMFVTTKQNTCSWISYHKKSNMMEQLLKKLLVYKSDQVSITKT